MLDFNPIFFLAFISRDVKQEQMQIRLNVVVALAAAQLAFLSGIDALEPMVRRQFLLLLIVIVELKKLKNH